MVAEHQADFFAGVEVPEALQASLERHRTNLARLILNLEMAGVSEEQIELSVSTIVSSHKQDLLRAIRALVR